MNNSLDNTQLQYSQMSDKQKLQILKTELDRDENDMRFKVQDRFVFDERVPWWVSIFSKMRYTLTIIPFILFLILALGFGLPVKVIRLVSMFYLLILLVLTSFNHKKKQGTSNKIDDGLSPFKLEVLYRESLLAESEYSKSRVIKKLIGNSLFALFTGLFVFSTFIPMFF